MSELDYREIQYRLEKILQKKEWTEDIKNNLRKMINQILEKNDDFVEEISKKNMQVIF